VWLSADVHYAAAHHFHPDRAATSKFKPFWEFVAGPFHAGTFGPGEIDTTFGPEVRYAKGAPEGQMGAGPAAGHQFFGEVQITHNTGVATVRLFDLQGVLLHTETLMPELT
jgi:alkaline phosphatase D